MGVLSKRKKQLILARSSRGRGKGKGSGDDRQEISLNLDRIRLKQYQHLKNLWIGRGTVMHKDTKNIGLLLAYYLGFDYGPSPLGYKTGGSLHHGGVGLPEKKFIWDHGSGSVMD